MPKASKKPILSVAEKLSRWKADFPVEDAEVAVQNSPLGEQACFGSSVERGGQGGSKIPEARAKRGLKGSGL